MYRLVIVEDEEIVRSGLKNHIPWEEWGFEVVREFEDGLEAYEWILENDCDVVLTDIMMSRMSGLEMAGRLKESRPETKVVILSGYGDFSYTRQAMQREVVDYLLKPIDEDELMAVFARLKDRLDQESRERQERESGQELLQTLRGSFFHNLLSGHIGSKAELSAYLKILKIEERIVECPILAYELRFMMNSDGRRVLEEKGVDFEELLRRYCVSKSGKFLYFVLGGQDSEWCIVIASYEQTEIERLRRHCRKKIMEIVQELNKATSCEFTCELTHAVQRLCDLVEESAGQVEEQYEGFGQEGKDELYQKILSRYKVFIVDLDLGNKSSLIGMVDRMIKEMEGISPEYARFIVKNLYSVIAEEYDRRRVSVAQITEGKFDSARLYRTDDLAEAVRDGFMALLEGLQELKAGYDSDVVGRIIQYIEKNLSGDLSNDTIAGKHHLHPVYMSRIFKQRTGENLSDYILRVKMEHAVELLRGGRLKVAEVSEKVGCSSPSYFSTVFRKYTGYAPLEYCYKMLT